MSSRLTGDLVNVSTIKAKVFRLVMSPYDKVKTDVTKKKYCEVGMS